MASRIDCDGILRRDFLRVGALGVGSFGLGLSDYLRAVSAGEVADRTTAEAAIFVNLGGGPSHLDTFDLKPDAPEEIRGEFRPIDTNVQGVRISELLPQLATCADKFAVLRGVSHTLADHTLGKKYISTGNRPLPSLEFPSFGAVVVKERGGARELPPYVAIPDTPQVAGYLGVRYSPLSTTSAPRPNQPYIVRGIGPGPGLTIEEIEKRRALQTQLDRAFAGSERESDLLSGLDEFSRRAYDIIRSPRSRLAFDVNEESSAIKGLFGQTPFSMSCLLAARLVEAGVRFVTVSSGGWDTHKNNFSQLREKLLPDLDRSISGLFRALEAKGLLASTTVIVTGEFGRTPKINKDAGRDHYPRAMTMLMGGGGIRGGQAVGASDERAMGPASGDGFSPDDVAATFYTTLGIDPAKEYRTSTGRPVAIVRHGKPIRSLFG